MTEEGTSGSDRRSTARLVEAPRRLVQDGRARLRGQAAALYERSPAPVRNIWSLSERTARDAIEDRVPGLAAEVALFTLISLPALLLMMLGSLGFIADALGPDGRAALDRIVFDLPHSVLSSRTYASYAEVARSALQDGRADVISVAVVLSLWTGSRATSRTLETITIAYDLEPRAGWRRRLLGLGLTVGVLLGAAAVLPLLVLGPRLVELVAPDDVATATLDVLGLLYWPGVGLLVLAALASLYHIGVPWRTPWRRDLPGAVLAMALWLVASAGLRAYLALSTRDDAVYGRLGTPIAVVLWFYVSAFALLLGAELNAEIERMWPHQEGRGKIARPLRAIRRHPRDTDT